MEKKEEKEFGPSLAAGVATAGWERENTVIEFEEFGSVGIFGKLIVLYHNRRKY